MRENVEIARMLLAAGVDANRQDSFGWTPLMCAANAGNIRFVQLLLNTDGIRLNTQSAYGDTALSLANKRGHEAVVKLLLDSTPE